MRKNELVCSRSPVFDVYALSVCALLTALSVVLARLLTVIPSEVSRFSLEAVPIILSGLLFGAVPGALVGFAADLIGCLFSPFGYNPIFCLPPILYGLWAGLLWQSMALALVYGGAARWPYFLTRLAARSVQFAVTGCIDTVLVWLLARRNALSPVLRRIKTKGSEHRDA